MKFGISRRCCCGRCCKCIAHRRTLTAVVTAPNLQQQVPSFIGPPTFRDLQIPLTKAAYDVSSTFRCYPWTGGGQFVVTCPTGGLGGLTLLDISISIICPGGLNSCGILATLYRTLSGQSCPTVKSTSCNDFVAIVSMNSRFTAAGSCVDYFLIHPEYGCGCNPVRVQFLAPTPDRYIGPLANCSTPPSGKLCPGWGSILTITIQ